jgi:diguanylate cyclase (GGDEF)-like protein
MPEDFIAITPQVPPHERTRECLARGESLRLSDPKQALEFAQEALRLAQSAGDARMLAEAERLYGRLSGDRGLPEDGLRYTLSSVRRFEELGDEANIALSLSAVGMAYIELCSFDDALAALERAEQIAKTLNDTELELRVTGNMSLAYADLQDFDRARAMMERTLALAKNLGRRDLTLRSHCNLGHIELEHGLAERQAGNTAAARMRFANAHEVMARALQLPGIEDSAFDLALTQLNLGIVFLQQGQLDAGQPLLEQARLAMLAIGDASGTREAEMYLALAKAYQPPAQAGIAALEAFARSNAPGITPLLRARAWRLLSEAADQSGDLQTAFNAFKQFHMLDRTILNERVSSRAAALSLKLDIERAQIEADVLRIHAEQLMDANTQLSAEASVLSRQAHEDGLTSLSNRRHFDERFPELLAQARQGGNDLYVAMADLDHFKKINDTFSHAVGDEVLRQVSAILRAHSRADDLVARYGGEEFVLVLQHANAEQARAACERLRASVEHRNWPALAQDLAVTMSIGVAQCDPSKTAQANIEAADQLLYRAKREGRNRVCT